MSDCILVQIDGDRYRCQLCGWEYHKHVRRNCPKARPLLGDRIAQLTRLLGIKPCGGCKKRQRWLNKQHAAAIGLVNGLHAAVRRRMRGKHDGH